MLHVTEILVVEGKYDRIRLQSVTDALIFTTEGFRIFHDKKRLSLLRRLAKDRGVVILTDSDHAGGQIRGFLVGALPGISVKQAYVPPVVGKEKRKSAPSKEGLLGVEGMDTERLIAALKAAGLGADTPPPTPWITRTRLYTDKLSGHADSARRRKAFLRLLELPEYLSTTRLLEVIGQTLSEEEYGLLLKEVEACLA